MRDNELLTEEEISPSVGMNEGLESEGYKLDVKLIRMSLVLLLHRQ